MGKLFGTDGARGVAGKDLTPELAMQIGRAAAAVLDGKIIWNRRRERCGKYGTDTGARHGSGKGGSLCAG
mgnify:CR=1 FL=1